MVVVKLGGSLFDYPKLSEWLKILSEEGAGKVVIVPGGGPFADQVRDAQKQWKFNDQQAHQMALHAMDQYGLMLAGIAEVQDCRLIPARSERKLQDSLTRHQTPVWLPSKWLEHNTEIPQNWTATSDSISAWLAKELNAEKLIFIKRVEVDESVSPEALGKENIVDGSFADFSRGLDIGFLKADQQSTMQDMLMNLECKVSTIPIEKWRQRLYNESKPNDLNTLFGQLSRIATNRAVFLSLKKMTEENNINVGDVFKDLIQEGYACDLVITTRRLLEKNYGNNEKKHVNSIRALVDFLDDEGLSERIKVLSNKTGEAGNKVFAHNDLNTADGERELNLSNFNEFDKVIRELKAILLGAADILDVTVPDKLVATNQFDWSQAFDKSWRANGFDDSEIWNEL